jgi:CRISPR-associated endonuclease/helicase Cas3
VEDLVDPAIAHTAGAGGKDHLLIDHLRDVAFLAGKLAEEARPCDSTFTEMAKWAGWLHDLGKYRQEFQEYLNRRRDKSAETQHAVFGAASAWERQLSRALSFAILGHHAGLHDLSTVQARVTSGDLNPAIQARQLSNRLLGEISTLGMALPEPCSEFIPRGRGRFDPDPRHELMIRMLFSCLVDADYLDTEQYMLGRSRSPLKLEAVELFNRLKKHIDALNAESTETAVNQVRRELFQRCVDHAEREPGFFSLTAPTGSGKTLAMMAFALKHAGKHELRRVIVVLPFLSIIEQNAAVYRDILGKNVVAEHHSAVELGSNFGRSGDTTQHELPSVAESTDQGLGTNQASLFARLASENWDAPIIVTTAVQFLESLFARNPSRCRKLHNVARSIVLFDEVQSLPLHLLEPIMSMLQDLKTDFGCSFLLSSATQPRFARNTHLLPSGFSEGQCHELAPEPKRIFEILRRTQFDLKCSDESAWTWETLIERVEDEPRVLVILNFRKPAQDLYRKLKERKVEGIFHLSSTMCAAHRQAVLGRKPSPDEGTIYHTLCEKECPCRLISTQVVEAGVDISFPVVFRHIAPLDAILQAAGRCNREGELPPDSSGRPGGRVVVFKLEGKPEAPRGFYREATGMTRSLLVNWAKDPDDLAADPYAFGEYHNTLIQWIETDSKDIQALRRLLLFEAVAREFKMIDEAGTGVIVPYGDSPKIVEQIRKRGIMTYEDRRRLQRYTVNLFPNWITALGGDLTPLVPGGGELFCNLTRFDEALGINLGELPVDMFVHG